MDYTKLRKFIVREVLARTLDWNAKAKAYPVKPAGLTESQETLWLLATGDTRIGELSAVQSKALREMIAESLGADLPVLGNKKLKDLPPGVALVSTKAGSWRIVSADRILFKKLSGPWVNEAGQTVEKEEFMSEEARLPTIEEVEVLVKAVPDDKLIVGFASLLPFKKKAEYLADLRAKMVASAAEFIKAKPDYGAIEPNELKAYKFAYAQGQGDALKLSCMMQGKEFNDKVWDSLGKGDVVPAIGTIMPLKIDGSPRLLTGRLVYLTKKGADTLAEYKWESVEACTEAEVDKLLKDAPMPFLYGYLAPEIRQQLGEELEVPDDPA